MPDLLCPVCGETLTFGEKAACCCGGHQFDRAKSGYINLLVSRQSGAQHGDDKEMVRARRAFLERGYYEPLQKALCGAVLRYAPAGGTDLLDAGCGECYYTAAAEQALLASGHTPHIAGVDISKDALRFGGRRGRDLHLAVASVYRLPVADASCDMVLNVFAPFAGAEYRRVLKADGVLIHVAPAAKHLWELKQAVYERPYENDAATPEQEGLALLSEQSVSCRLALNSREDVANLFQMTPYAHKTHPADIARLDAVDRLETEASFLLRVYGRERT